MTDLGALLQLCGMPFRESGGATKLVDAATEAAQQSVIIVGAGVPPSVLRERVNSTLRGHEFIGDAQVYTDPKDFGYGLHTPRQCELCFYWKQDDCRIANNPAKNAFGVDEHERMLPILDGKQVGNYCTFFTDQDAE